MWNNAVGVTAIPGSSGRSFATTGDEEADMGERRGRREFLEVTALTAAAMAVGSTPWPALAQSSHAAGGHHMKTAYDPAAKFELKVSEVEFRRAVSERMLIDRKSTRLNSSH